MPHNLETLCLCYTDQTSSEVPISRFESRHRTEGRGDCILLPSVIPAQVQGHHNTTRSTHTIGYPLQRQRRQAIREGVGDTIQTLEALGQDPRLQ